MSDSGRYAASPNGTSLARSGVLALLAACGGGGGPSDADLRDALVDGGLGADTARCMVGELSDEWSDADKDAIVDLDAEHDFSVSVERTDEVAADCVSGD